MIVSKDMHWVLVNFTEIQCIGENDDTIFNFESFAELANVISDALMRITKKRRYA